MSMSVADVARKLRALAFQHDFRNLEEWQQLIQHINIGSATDTELSQLIPVFMIFMMETSKNEYANNPAVRSARLHILKLDRFIQSLNR